MDAAETAARRHFAELIVRPEIPLAEAALAIAEEEYPQLARSAYLARIEALAARTAARLGGRGGAAPALRALRETLFGEAGFRGNDQHYYDPRNSFLNEVLDRRLGIPISLSVVFLSVAHRIGLPVQGVAFPGHFLVKHVASGRELFIDPYRGGEVLTADDCQERWRAQSQGRGAFEPRFLEAASPRQILARMLHNLKRIYGEAGDDVRTLWVVDRLLLLFPGDPGERRDRGLLSARLGGRAAAVIDLEAYLSAAPGAHDAEEIRGLVMELKRRRGWLN